MKTLYQYKIVTYVLSILGIIAAFFLLIFGVITWATNTLATNIENRIEEFYGSNVIVDRFYSEPLTAEEILYIRYQRNGIINYASFNYETLDIYVDATLPPNAIELPSALYLTNGLMLLGIALLVGVLSIVLLVVTIMAHVKGNKSRRLAIQPQVPSSQYALEEAKSMYDKGLLTSEEYEIRRKSIIDKL